MKDMVAALRDLEHVCYTLGYIARFEQIKAEAFNDEHGHNLAALLHNMKKQADIALESLSIEIEG